MLKFDDVGISNPHANSYVRYKDLDKSNLIKCLCCHNYTDITCEQYDLDSLSAWLDLMHTSDDIGYVCKYCESMNKQIKFAKESMLYLSSQYEKLSSESEQNKKDLALCKNRISDYNIKLSTIEQDLPAVKDKIFKRNKHNENGNQDKYIKEIAQTEIFVKPKVPKEVVPLHPEKTKDPLYPVNTVREKYIRKKRLVFIGVPKDTDDETFIEELSGELNLGLNRSAIKKTFRIKARNIPANKTPPLNIEFCDATERSKILNQLTRDKIANLPSNSRFRDIKFFPDRSYKHRKKYKELKLQMDIRNSSLPQNVKTLKWKIKNMSLIKVLDLDIGETTT